MKDLKIDVYKRQYIGRALLFLAMGQLQALVVVLGDLYILKIDCTHPFMLWLAAAITSLSLIHI